MTGFGITCESAAQTAKTDLTQSALAAKSPADQATALNELVRSAWKDRKCAQASVSLEKTYDNGNGGWLVNCNGETDYWVTVPATGGGVIALPCIVARQAGVDCYANLRDASDAASCDANVKSLDRIIRSCTAIIRSGRFTSKADVLSVVYEVRGTAFVKYNAFDAALADFDQAVSLWPNNLEHLYNRAVTLERMGKYDQAIPDLDKILLAKPDQWNASYQRGYAFLKKGDYKRAIDDFDQVLRVNPGLEQAVSQRAAALQAFQAGKQAPPSAPQANRPHEEAAEGPNEKAAYCMEVSFGFTQQLTGMVSTFKQAREKASSPPGDAAKLAADQKKLDASIVEGERQRSKWAGITTAFTNYLQQHGLFQNKSLIQTMSAKAGKDQREVQETRQDCVRTCGAGDMACRTACEVKVVSLPTSQRMKRCEQLAQDIK